MVLLRKDCGMFFRQLKYLMLQEASKPDWLLDPNLFQCRYQLRKETFHSALCPSLEQEN